MKKLDRLFFKYRNYGVKRLMMFIIAGTVTVFVLSLVGRGDVVSFLCFSPALIAKGEVWRLITFIFIPEDYSFFFIFWVVFYYWGGTALENYWGTLKFNVFYLSGIVMTVFYGFIANIILGPLRDFFIIWGSFSASAINLSLLLVLATLAPNEEIMFFGMFPLKLKWLAFIDLGIMLIPVIRAPLSVFSYSGVAALLNYAVFLGPTLIRNVKDSARRKTRNTARTVQFKSAVRSAKQAKGYVHKCAECGITDADAPGKEFRYCSLCSGYQCYCSDHIFNHEHRKG